MEKKIYEAPAIEMMAISSEDIMLLSLNEMNSSNKIEDSVNVKDLL